MTAWGIDISNRNPGANLAEVKQAGASLVYLKATEGVDFTDGLFAGYRRQALACGLPFGAYHFAHPQPGRSPESEVAHFLGTLRAAGSAIGGGAGQLRPALDLEWTELGPGDTTAWAVRFMRLIEQDTGITPAFYSYPGFMAERMLPSPSLASFPLWLASYRDDAPPAPAPWPAWSLWQHTSTARVPGVPGFVDRSILGPRGLATLTIPHAPKPLPPAHAPTPTHAPAHKPPVTIKGGGTVLGSRVLVKGDRGDDVKFLQRFLGLAVQDGIFGDKTEAAVKAYQHMRGLVPDGEVGRLTWAPMLGH